MSLHWLQKPMYAIVYTDMSKVLLKLSVAWSIWRCESRTGRCGGWEEEDGTTEVAPLIAWSRHLLPSQGAPLIECHSSRPVIQLVSMPRPTWPFPWEVMNMHN